MRERSMCENIFIHRVDSDTWIRRRYIATWFTERAILVVCRHTTFIVVKAPPNIIVHTLFLILVQCERCENTPTMSRVSSHVWFDGGKNSSMKFMNFQNRSWTVLARGPLHSTQFVGWLHITIQYDTPQQSKRERESSSRHEENERIRRVENEGRIEKMQKKIYIYSREYRSSNRVV